MKNVMDNSVLRKDLKFVNYLVNLSYVILEKKNLKRHNIYIINKL